MNRFVITFKSATSTRMVTVAANDVIAARIVADQTKRQRGETIVNARRYEDMCKITCR